MAGSVSSRVCVGSSSQHRSAVLRVIQYMRERLSRNVTVSEMAAVAHMSSFHFVRVFRDLTGSPPARFFTALRIQWAKRELIDTDRTVWQICQDCGYQSLGTFTSRFTRLVGLPPAQFRELFQSKVKATPYDPRTCSSPTTSCSSTLEIGQPVITGTVGCELKGDERLFVGVFDSPTPQHVPSSYHCEFGSQSFSLPMSEKEPCFIHAMILRPREGWGEIFNNGQLVDAVGGYGPICETDLGRSIHIQLRSIDSLDPPILIALPLWVDF